MKEKLCYFFAFSGRISRRTYLRDKILLGILSILVAGLLLMLTKAFLSFMTSYSSLQMFSDMDTALFEEGGIKIFIAVATGLLFLAGSFSVDTRRLHDLGYSGYWTLLFFVVAETKDIVEICFSPESLLFKLITSIATLLGVAFSFVLLFKRGTNGDNEYGKDPLAKMDATQSECLSQGS